MSRIFKKSIGILLLCLFLFPFCLHLSYVDKRYNVILIILDALRADYVRCNTHENLTPNLCSFATNAVNFRNAFSASTGTPMSFSSFLTSRYPIQIGIYEFYQGIPRGFSILDILRRRGYFTAVLTPHQGVCSILNISEVDLCGEIKIEKIIYKQPFFLLIHLMETHHAFDYPIGNECDHLQINITSLNLKLKKISFDHLRFNKTYFSPTEIECLRKRYEIGIKNGDKRLGEILKLFKEYNIFQNTLLIITADHGEALGEHGTYFHSGPLYNELIHVPLIIKFPSTLNRTIEQSVSLIDIVPTILDFLDVTSNLNFEGISLLTLIEGVKTNRTLYAFINGEALISNDWKYICWYKGCELYNLKEDPKELSNLAERYPEMTKNFEKELSKSKNELLKNSIRPIDLQLEKSIKERLEELGYLVD